MFLGHVRRPWTALKLISANPLGQGLCSNVITWSGFQVSVNSAKKMLLNWAPPSDPNVLGHCVLQKIF